VLVDAAYEGPIVGPFVAGPGDHSITGPNGEVYPVVSYPVSGIECRVETSPRTDAIRYDPRVPLINDGAFGAPYLIPSAPLTRIPSEGVIVSLVAAVPCVRLDGGPVYRPDSGPDALRDAEGRIVAVRRLIRAAP
jgi:hypothetical protein